MSKPISFEGVYPILATPFNNDGTLDLDPRAAGGLRVTVQLPPAPPDALVRD